MLTKEQEEQVREIARDITERADNGEFGWAYGINGGIPWEDLQKIIENTPPSLRLVNGRYVPIEEED
jgi:hypothetical protein